MSQNTINQRINDVISQSGSASETAFARTIGVAQTTLNGCIRGTEPRVGLVQSILTALPALSAEWLMRGEGPMWRAPAAQSAGDNSVLVGSGSTVGDIANGGGAVGETQEARRLAEEVARLKGENGVLREQLAAVTALLAKRE